ncbi:MAG: RNA-binding protein [Candidatus Yanofskybacteria bacterium]|nr:RNA-binding protein [Candidatus Yanofskybacteria bacterium]
MAKRLYIGNLSYDTTDDSLRNAFAEVGPVASASVMKDRMSGRSRGFAFVEMENDDDAPKAIERWNGQELDGRKLIVNEARPMTTDRPPRRGGFGGGGRGFGGGGQRDY